MAAPHTGMTQLIDGNFQDANGAPLALGYIIMQLSQDAQSSQQSQVDGGRTITITLDANGNADAGQYVWPNTALNPSTTYYIVNVYSAAGQLVWGPNYMLVDTVPTFDLDTWVPNQIGGGGTPAGSIVFQTNGVNNGSQQLLNLQQGTNVTLTDNGSGQITIAASGGSAGNGPRNRGLHDWAYAGNNGIEPPTGAGCTPSASGATFSLIAPTATDTAYLGVGTGSSANTITPWIDTVASPADQAYTLGILGLFEKRLILPSIANIRVWIGLELGMSSGANFWKSDAPPLPTVAFRYSTAAADTKWQCVVTDGSTQLTVDSGITVDTAGHIFGIEFSTPNVLFFIDGTQVASVAISTTTLTAASLFCGCFSVDNVGLGNNKVVGIDYMYWDTSPI
jgi:hypothetical protein